MLVVASPRESIAYGTTGKVLTRLILMTCIGGYVESFVIGPAFFLWVIKLYSDHELHGIWKSGCIVLL